MEQFVAILAKIIPPDVLQKIIDFFQQVYVAAGGSTTTTVA
ncbi:MAG: hypothetical protein RR229_02840 [Oscillospiraceae bacterium]